MRIGGIALTLLAAACGSSSSASSYGDFQQQGRKLFCQIQVNCGRLDSAYESACEQSLAVGGQPDPSTFSFNSGAAGGCLDAFKQALSSCTKSSLSGMMFMDACASVLTGKVPAGGACPYGVECAPGSACSLSFSSMSCSSKCIALGNIGDKCDPAGGCVAGAYCDFQSTMCKARLDSGGACTSDGNCKSGLYCVGTMMTCAAPGGSGAPCAMYEPQSCSGDLVCESASKTCVAAKPMGAACSAAEECVSPMICFGGTGTTMGTCQPLAGKGASCTTTSCIGPYLCANGICTVPPDLGEACTTVCLNGYCNKNSQKCEAPIAIGAACDPTAASGLQCENPSFCDGPTKTCKLCQ